MLAVVDDVGEVLQRGPAVGGLRQSAGGAPPVGGRQRAVGAGRRGRGRGGRGQAGPLLVAAAVARPQLHGGAVGGRAAGDVQAQAGLDAGDRSVGVHPPLLVRAAAAGPDLHPGAGGGGVVGDVQALVAVDGQLVGGRQRPLLVGAVPAVVELKLGAVGLAAAHHVEAAAGRDAAQGAGGGGPGGAGDEHRRQRGHDRDQRGEQHGQPGAARTWAVHGTSWGWWGWGDGAAPAPGSRGGRGPAHLKFQCWLAPPLESQIWTGEPLPVWPPGISRARPLAALSRV